MLVLFGSHYGKDTSTLDSGYLVWIIEKYEDADWALIQACKTELSNRLKLEWVSQSKLKDDATIGVHILNRQLLARIDLLEKCLIMSTSFNASCITIDGYLQNPKLLELNLKLIREANQS